MSSLEQIPLKKIFLRSLIVSVSISAALGILVILIGDFGRFETKVLITTLTLSGASLFGMCGGAAIEIRGKHWTPLAAFFTTAITAILLIFGIWVEVNHNTYWKLTGTFGVFAFAFSHLSLLHLARLTKTYAWALPAAYGIILSLAGLITGMIWENWPDDFVARLLGVLAILDAAISILIPVFHRLGSEEFEKEQVPDLATIDREIEQLETRLSELRELRQASQLR